MERLSGSTSGRVMCARDNLQTQKERAGDDNPSPGVPWPASLRLGSANHFCLSPSATNLCARRSATERTASLCTTAGGADEPRGIAFDRPAQGRAGGEISAHPFYCAGRRAFFVSSLFREPCTCPKADLN